jgi:hypothetical protein
LCPISTSTCPSRFVIRHVKSSACSPALVYAGLANALTKLALTLSSNAAAAVDDDA